MKTQEVIDKLENTKVELEISVAFKPNTSIDWVRYAIVKEKVQLLDEIIKDLKNLNEETRKDFAIENCPECGSKQRMIVVCTNFECIRSED